MNKLALVLIFSVIALIKTANPPVIDVFNTEPYHSFDWTDEDEQTFSIKFYDNSDMSNIVVFLYNQSKVCLPKCTASGTKLDCKLTGPECEAEKDNPAYKYYYAAYWSNQNDAHFNSSYSAKDIIEALARTTNRPTINDATVTIAVCSSNFLKYSMFLLSLLIL